MLRYLFTILAAVSAAVSAMLAYDGSPAESEYNWPQWRGPLGVGVAPAANPPVEWSESKNVRWKIALPGKGHSTPIVWRDHVFITTAVPYGDEVEPRYDNAPGAHHSVPVTHPHNFVVLAQSGAATERKSGNRLCTRNFRTREVIIPEAWRPTPQSPMVSICLHSLAHGGSIA